MHGTASNLFVLFGIFYLTREFRRFELEPCDVISEAHEYDARVVNNGDGK